MGRVRYITIVALAFAFAGSAHGANNDLKAARKGGEEDTARKPAERTAHEIAKPEIYWLDSAYRRSDGADDGRPRSDMDAVVQPRHGLFARRK
jgi:hypothetical protein